MTKPIVWTIAGSDSGGGAGIQADVLTMADFHVHGCSVITALTAQNSVAVHDIQYTSAVNFSAQLHALASDLPAQVIKIGMLGDEDTVNVLVAFLKETSATVIYDPVMVASSGSVLVSAERMHTVIKTLLPHVDLLTPNLLEVNALLKTTVKAQEDIERSALALLALGPKHVLIKGGHGEGEWSCDYYSDGTTSFWLNTTRFLHGNTHGSGCSLSAAIAALLAQHYTMHDAIVIAKMYVTQGIRLAERLGHGAGPVAHAGWPQEPCDLPMLTQDAPMAALPSAFPSCGDQPLGFYPIVDSFAWVKRLVPLGIKTLQLRIKDGDPQWIEEQIKHSVEYCADQQVRLFINDYWQLAIHYQAYGVHVGQEDLASVDIIALRNAGLRLGVSTHCYTEVARAHALRPSYIAVGPIFHTDSKPMAFRPQGITLLQHWCRVLSDYRVVAIGGIDDTNLPRVLETKADGVAVISAVTKSPDPEATVVEWLRWIEG